MDVVDGLARARIHVEHGAVALLMDIRLRRQFLGNLEHLADKRVIVRRYIVQRRNVFLGNNQEVHWRLRPKVFDCHHEVILMHKIRRSIASDDSAKKACLLHRCNLALLGHLLCTTFVVIQPQKSTRVSNGIF